MLTRLRELLIGCLLLGIGLVLVSMLEEQGTGSAAIVMAQGRTIMTPAPATYVEAIQDLLAALNSTPEHAARLATLQTAQAFFAATNPPAGYAAIHAHGAFAIDRCIQVLETGIAAAEAGDQQNPLYAAWLINPASECRYALQALQVLLRQAPGE